MSEIKFRGFSISKKAWVYGFIWIVPGVNLHYILTGKIDVKDCSIEKYEVYPESVGQYTGLHDNTEDEKEIYEKDKIRFVYEEQTNIGYIDYDGGSFHIVCNELPDSYIQLFDIASCDRDYWWIEGEVIGNIYENKNLLEVENE